MLYTNTEAREPYSKSEIIIYFLQRSSHLFFQCGVKVKLSIQLPPLELRAVSDSWHSVQVPEMEPGNEMNTSHHAGKTLIFYSSSHFAR